MIEGKYCPFCGAKATSRCAHLALAARATDFVGRCVERCQGEAFWQVLVNDPRDPLLLNELASDDFLWLETSFSSRFLERLGWFGRMEYEWRDGDRSPWRELWVLLWSKEPQRLWWQLRDELECQRDDITQAVQEALILEKEAEAEAEALQEEAETLKQEEENHVPCPVCGCNNQEGECIHLVFHGDDLRTQSVIEECGEAEAWEILKAQAPRSAPDFAVDFFDKFGEQFPSLIKACGVSWEGGMGMSGVYAYVWSKDRVELQNEISRFMKRRTGKFSRQKTEVGSTQNRQLKVRASRSKRKVRGRSSSCGGC